MVAMAAVVTAAVLLLAFHGVDGAANGTAGVAANGTAGVAAPVRRALRVSKTVQQKFDDIGTLKKQLKKLNKKYEKPKVPKRIVAAAKQKVEGIVSSMAMNMLGGCGARLPAASLGFRRSKTVAAWKNLGLLEVGQHPGEDSFSIPGAGADQVLKDDGLSENGKVNGEAPYLRVLKDGFFEVGCFTDSMLELGDKFGDNKDQYKELEKSNVSIAKYKELIMEDEQKTMTPTVCFEFCRTLPRMVFFGINNGDDCYCAPFFKPMPGNDKQCDVPCAGESTAMCGNADRSTIWEMHLCADTAAVLQETMVEAKSALDFYYENIVLAGNIGSQMTRTGMAVEKLAGLSGAPEAAKNGIAAKLASKALSQAHKKGKAQYELLLDAYTAALDAKAGDISDPTVMSSAEASIRTMKATTGPVIGLANEVHNVIVLAYPPVDTEVFGEDPDPEDEVAVELATEGNSAGFDFRPATYVYNKITVTESSSCAGPIINTPIVGLGLPQCAKVCEATTYPKLCVAFSWYLVKETDQLDGVGLNDLCILLSDVKVLETFSCPAPEASFLQKVNATKLNRAKHRAARKLEAEVAEMSVGKAKAKEPEAAHGAAECMVKMSEVSTGWKPANNAKYLKYERCFGATSDEPVSMPEAYKAFKMPDVAKMEEDGKDTIAPPP